MFNLDIEYNRMWEEFKQSTQAGMFFHDLPPQIGENRWGVSLIFKLQLAEQLTNSLQHVVNELKPLVGDSHLYYNADTLHSTVRSLLPYQTKETVNSQLLDYLEVIKTVTQKFAPIIISYSGLTAHKATIMAKGYPEKDDLVQLREKLASELTKNKLESTPELLSIRKTAHASLVVLSDTLNNPSDLLKYLDTHKNTYYGEIPVSELEVVSYLRQHSNLVIQSLATINLT